MSLVSNEAFAAISDKAEQEAPYIPANTSDNVRQVLKCFINMPPWFYCHREQQLQIVTKFALKISKHSLPDIRQAEIIYQAYAYDTKSYIPNSDSTLGIVSKMFVVNRYIFAIPTSGYIHEHIGPHFWPSQPKVNASWPISKSNHGSLEVSGTSMDYEGAPYFPVKDFDYLQHRYGQRRT